MEEENIESDLEKIKKGLVQHDEKVFEDTIVLAKDYSPVNPVSFPNELYEIDGKANLPVGEYVIKKDVFIKERGLLTIKPGTAFLFNKGTGLISYGNLNAIGTVDKNIVFTANNDSWDNIRIGEEHSDKSVLEHCLIEKGTGNGTLPPGDEFKGFTYNLLLGGAIFLYITNTTIKNCVFRKNSSDFGGAINIHDNSPKIISCTFYDNSANTQGGAINYSGPGITMTLKEVSKMKKDVKPIIADNKIFRNESSIGGGMYIERFLGEITNNVIKKNIGQLETGGIYINTSDMVFENNTIQQNESLKKGGGLKYYNAKFDLMKFGTNKIENNKPDDIYAYTS